ncbi:MAG: hypothetical protein IKD04_06690 [Clostridia bacterium]|nr:hypothetical protein [Clostridia bacterium]
MSVLRQYTIRILAIISVTVMLATALLCSICSAEENFFLRETPPEIPKGNINLITTYSTISDTSNKALEISYDKLNHILQNKVDDKNGFVKFEGIKGLKMSDTYMYRLKLTVFSAQPNPEYNDSTSQGARIIFRGNDNASYCFFSLFSSSASYYSYIENSMLGSKTVTFDRELNKEYDICILTGPTELSVWVDNVLFMHETDMPNFEPYIGAQIYRSSVKLADIEVYNMAPDDKDALASEEKNVDVLTSYKEFEGVDGKLPSTETDLLTRAVIWLSVAVAALLALLTAVFIPIIKRKKGASK